VNFDKDHGVGEMIMDHMFCLGFVAETRKLQRLRLVVPPMNISWANVDHTLPQCTGGFSCFWERFQPHDCQVAEAQAARPSKTRIWKAKYWLAIFGFEFRWGPLLYASALTAWWWRPRREVTQRLHKDASAIGLHKDDAPCIAMHVRHGDSCHAEWRHCVNFQRYMEVAEGFREKYGFRRIFLATDDDSVIRSVKRYPKFEFMFYRDVPRARYNIQGQWIERSGVEKLGKSPFYEVIRDVHSASFCSAFIGTFDASMSHLMLYLMIHRLGIIPPFHSVNGPYCRKRVWTSCCIGGLMPHSMCKETELFDFSHTCNTR